MLSVAGRHFRGRRSIRMRRGEERHGGGRGCGGETRRRQRHVIAFNLAEVTSRAHACWCEVLFPQTVNVPVRCRHRYVSEATAGHIAVARLQGGNMWSEATVGAILIGMTLFYIGLSLLIITQKICSGQSLDDGDASDSATGSSSKRHGREARHRKHVKLCVSESDSSSPDDQSCNECSSPCECDQDELCGDCRPCDTPSCCGQSYCGQSCYPYAMCNYPPDPPYKSAYNECLHCGELDCPEF
ncbi:hypothetical protein LSAT2_005872 [Lamellibrachia satsuma]|nr:hypothetical protein LSAT2_005872 [Lamellibrachia satsuma]